MPDQEQAVATVNTPSRLDGRIDIDKALKLRLKGCTYQEIANQFGVTPQAVEQRLSKHKRFLEDPEQAEAYDRNRAQILNAVELEIVRSMLEPAKLKDASLNNAAYALQQVTNARRLELGQSTANVSQLTQIIQAAEQQPIPQDIVVGGHTDAVDTTAAT